MHAKTMMNIAGSELDNIRRRLGNSIFERRMHLEATRELHFFGLIRWCPMKWQAPLANLVVRALGRWHSLHEQYLDIQVHSEEFIIRNLPAAFDGFTLLLMGDLHLDLSEDFPSVLKSRLESVRGRYDVAVVVGDINNFTVHSGDEALQIFKSLAPSFSAPVYGVLGNHDSLLDVPFLEKECAMRLLLNEGVRLRRGDESLWLAGVDDPDRFGTHDTVAALRGAVDGEKRILLAHSPIIYSEAVAHGIDLVFCGHVHGGQACTRSGRPLPLRRWKFPFFVRSGRWQVGATQGYTTTGAGACGVALRMNCPPEIVLVTLRSERS